MGAGGKCGCELLPGGSCPAGDGGSGGGSADGAKGGKNAGSSAESGSAEDGKGAKDGKSATGADASGAAKGGKGTENGEGAKGGADAKGGKGTDNAKGGKDAEGDKGAKDGKGTEGGKDAEGMDGTGTSKGGHQAKDSVKITFDACGGTLAKSAGFSIDAGTVGAVDNLPIPTCGDSKFLGWYDGLPGEGSKVAPGYTFADDTTLYAYWSHKVSFDAGAGTFDDKGTRTLVFYTDETGGGTLPALPTPTREHYIFAGWYTAEEGGELVRDSSGGTGIRVQAVAGTSLAASQPLYARWDPVVYPVDYNLVGGSYVTEYPASFTFEDWQIKLVAPGRSGYTFEGWTWEGQDTPVQEPSFAPWDVLGKTFEAHWSKKGEAGGSSGIGDNGAGTAGGDGASSMFSGDVVAPASMPLDGADSPQADRAAEAAPEGKAPAQTGDAIPVPALLIALAAAAAALASRRRAYR